MGIRDRPTSFRSPWQNGYVERLIGSIRHECLDHLIAFNAEHLLQTLLGIRSLAGYTIDMHESKISEVIETEQESQGQKESPAAAGLGR
jgi:transposase InsO family protein